MIERDGKHYNVTCDKCAGGHATVEANTFVDAVGQIKELGWKIVRRDGEWLHLCPDGDHQ